ncbi:MAG: hypothetical protein ACRC92_04885 [Peptostreptococcaceae bacterium]
MNKEKFIKGTERLINPIEVGTIHFIQYFNKFIPNNIKKQMVNSSGSKTPYMGFVVEPYSVFLCYEIEDIERAKTFLPEGFKLIKTKIFEDDEPKYYSIFGCINAHTSGFWGSRVEFYIIAEDTTTGLLSWIIVDYDTNTITYDPKNILSDPSVENLIITTDYTGELFVDFENKDGRKLIFNSNIKQGKIKPLDKRLWVEGNLSIAYGKNKSKDDAGKFSLIFNHREFKEALKISSGNLTIKSNNWFPGLFKSEPSEIVCFPYAQHFLSDSPGHYSDLRSEEDLNKAVEDIDFNNIKPFSTKSFKATFLIGGLISGIINIILLILLILK